MRSPVDISPRRTSLSPLIMIAGVMCCLRLASSVLLLSPLTFGVLLLTLAAFLVSTSLLSFISVTQHAGEVLRSRIIDAHRNWEWCARPNTTQTKRPHASDAQLPSLLSEPMRSFIELFACISVVLAAFTASQHLPLSLLCGVLSSWLIIFCGEALTVPCRELEQLLQQSCGDSRFSHGARTQKGRVGCSMGVLLLYCWSALSLIYEHVTDLLLASVLATVMLAGLLLASKVITAFPPTRAVGEVLQDRLLRTGENWVAHPLRSGFELCVCMGSCILVYGWSARLLLALQAGAGAGMLGCLTAEALAIGLARDWDSRKLRHAPVVFLRAALPYTAATAFGFMFFQPRAVPYTAV